MADETTSMIPRSTSDPAGAAEYSQAFASLRQRYRAGALSGVAAIELRAEMADRLVLQLWKKQVEADGSLASAVALLAAGGYGRQELFPNSDLDLLFLLRDASMEKKAAKAIRSVNKQLWDCGNRVTAMTRTVPECLRFDPVNAEFSLSLLDSRFIAGNPQLASNLQQAALPAMLQKERRAITERLLTITRARHARFGDTIFHLEPNVKECPGGLRDANVIGWLGRLNPSTKPDITDELQTSCAFLASVRCFLHFRYNRDSNVLDWSAQDDAARDGIGFEGASARDAAGFMQLYFRHARVIARRLEQDQGLVPEENRLLRIPAAFRKRKGASSGDLYIEDGRIVLQQSATQPGLAIEADTALNVFEMVAPSGARPALVLETRIENALPLLSAQMDEGPALWRRLARILEGEYAGMALRSMHTLGVLELILPEFHGIDALVIRDAYHRYTVDEHTFVLIDALHALHAPAKGPLADWTKCFGTLLAETEHADLLYLAALLHDTGKGRSTDHTLESTHLARGVLQRLELEDLESGLVLNLIRNHLEMSAALRRDIFDSETVRTFATKVQTPEALRMLALFTYADIQAVNPDAMTPWKAENLWRLYIATSNFLDRNIDDERVDSRISSDLLQRVTALLPGETREVLRFLEGFPQRYLRTRSPENIRSQFLMSKQLVHDPVRLELNWRADRSELTLVTPDQRLLFARVAGVLSGWGMNIITADAFSNTAGIVVDSFRFTDTYRTLELNPGERERLLSTVREALADDTAAQRIVANRRRSSRRKSLVNVETSLVFDGDSSIHATVLQVVAQDHPGLLYAISTAVGEAQCNIEVAVIDTEGDTAIDVFYLTRDGKSLDGSTIQILRDNIPHAIAANAS